MIDPPGELASIAALLSASSATTIQDAKAVYVALARSRVETLGERLRELRELLEAQERELARQHQARGQEPLAGLGAM